MKSTQPQQIAVGAKSTGGIAANSLMRPIIVVLAILHIVIFALIVQINATSAKLSAVSRTAGERIEEATSVLAGASLLSETSTNFIMVPVHEHGEINVAPLAVFATELARPHRGNQVLERFRNYDVSPEALARLKDAAGNAEKLKDAQLHALALINSVYPFPNVYPVNQIPLPELNEAEKAMPAERRLAQSRIVALGSVASMNKRAVSQNVNACKDILRANVGAAAAEVGKKIVILRTVLLGLAGLVMLILIGTFVALYKQMIHP